MWVKRATVHCGTTLNSGDYSSLVACSAGVVDYFMYTSRNPIQISVLAVNLLIGTVRRAAFSAKCNHCRGVK